MICKRGAMTVIGQTGGAGPTVSYRSLTLRLPTGYDIPDDVITGFIFCTTLRR